MRPPTFVPCLNSSYKCHLLMGCNKNLVTEDTASALTLIVLISAILLEILSADVFGEISAKTCTKLLFQSSLRNHGLKERCKSKGDIKATSLNSELNGKSL